MYPIVVKPSPYKDSVTAYYYGWMTMYKETFVASVTDNIKDAIHNRSFAEALKKCDELNRKCSSQTFEAYR